MSDDRDKCGSTDTDSGDPCQRDAGWGTDTDHGPCKTHRDPGRPSKLTHERQEGIAVAVEDGTPLVAACRLNEISHQTHKNWFDRGERDAKDGKENIYTEYFGRLARALGYDESKKSKQMWETAMEDGDPQAMQTVLKQRYPETWQDQDLGEAQASIPLVVPDNAVPDDA